MLQSCGAQQSRLDVRAQHLPTLATHLLHAMRKTYADGMSHVVSHFAQHSNNENLTECTSN